MKWKFSLPCWHTHQQNKWLHDTNVQCIQITVLHHPLKGQNLKVIRQVFLDNERQFIIELPDGHTQLIPARWTESNALSAGSAKTDFILFGPSSLRTLVRMVAYLKSQLQPEDNNGSDTPTPIVGDFQPRNASTIDLSIDRPASPTYPKSSVAPERKDR